MKAQDIIKKARKELIDFIIFEIKLLYIAINKQEPMEGESWWIESTDLSTGIYVTRFVTDVEGNYYGEKMQVGRIYVEDKDVMINDIDDTIDMNISNIDTDEIAHIANVLEDTFKGKIA